MQVDHGKGEIVKHVCQLCDEPDTHVENPHPVVQLRWIGR
jgi:hypothetical protein